MAATTVSSTTAAATMVSSAGVLLAMLNESRPELKQHALSNLNTFVDFYWPEISTSSFTIDRFLLLSRLKLMSVGKTYLCHAVEYYVKDSFIILKHVPLFLSMKNIDFPELTIFLERHLCRIKRF